MCVDTPFTFEVTSKTLFLLLLVWSCGKVYAEWVRILLCPDNDATSECWGCRERDKNGLH